MNDPLRDSITDEALPPSTATPPGTSRLETFLAALDRVEAGWANLLTQAGQLATSMRAIRWVLVASVGLSATVGVGMAAHAYSISGRLSEVTARLDEITSTLEQARASAQRTEEKVQDVGAQVDEVKASQPTLVLEDAGAGAKPRVGLALPVTKPKPKASVDADAGPAPPVVSLPLALPPGSKTVVDDAGAP